MSRQPEAIEEVGGPQPRGTRREARGSPGDLEVLAGGEPAEDLHVLEHADDSGPEDLMG